MSNHQMNGDPMDDWRFGFEVKSDQIGQAEVGEGTTFTISGVDFERVGDEKRMRPIVNLRGHEKRWVTCRTTLECVEAMYGRSPRDWVGKPITLYWDPTVKFGKDTKGGVRVAGAPGIRNMTITIRLPRKRPFDVRLVDTAPKVDVGEAREKFLSYAAGKGIEREQIDAFLQHHGTALEKLSTAELRTLAGDLEDVRAFGAESDG